MLANEVRLDWQLGLGWQVGARLTENCGLFPLFGTFFVWDSSLIKLNKARDYDLVDKAITTLDGFPHHVEV